MNIEIERIRRTPNRLLTPKELERRLSAFANVLAHGRWFDFNDIQKVQATQSITEQVGEDRELGEPGEEIEIDPIFNEITVSFAASKQVGEEGDETFILPRYTLKSTVTQDIEKDEIPTRVLDEIFKDAQEDDHPAHDVLEHANFSDVLDIGIEGVMGDGADNLDQFEIQRSQDLEYNILYDGVIEGYSLSYSYSFDDVVLHTKEHNQSYVEPRTETVVYPNAGAEDRHAVYLPKLTQEKLDEHLETLDERADAFFIEQAIHELEQFADMPQEEHIRRVFGMLAMVSSGYSPRRWYNRMYDNLLYRRLRKS